MNLQKPSSQRKLVNEINVHKALDHENIVRFHKFFSDDSNVYLLMDMCPNRTLSAVLKRRKTLSELEVRYFTRQICQGLLYLHDNDVVHRDIKLGNIFLGEHMKVKIGDFGLSAKLKSKLERRTTLCGTPNYIAPEVLDDTQCKGHSKEVDIWSLGVLIYILLFGKPPFDSDQVKRTYLKIKVNDYIFPADSDVTEEAKEFIRQILVTKPSKRLKLQEILNHPYINKESLPNSLPKVVLTEKVTEGDIQDHLNVVELQERVERAKSI